MLPQDSYSYIHIGLLLRFLQNVSNTNSIEDVVACINTLDDKFKYAGFDVSLAAEQANTYGVMEVALTADKAAGKLENSTILQIKDVYANLERIVFAEAITKKIYILPNRRFNSEYLLNEPAKLLKAGAFDKLDEIAKADIASACRCILFGEATAAAFHILRATESVLKSYYFHHRKQNRLDKPMWAGMVEELRAKTKNKPPTILLDSLELIRKGYRNPTQHPEAVYEIDSVQDLFGVCLDAIGKMAMEL